MPSPPAVSRLVPGALLGLLAALSAAVLAFAPRPTGLSRPCEASGSLRLGARPESLPLALAHHRGALYALLGTETPRGVHLDVLRVRDHQVHTVASREAPSWASVSGFVPSPEGPVFAVARGPEVTATLVSSSPPRDSVFPRAEQPPGRPDASPGIALALEALSAPDTPRVLTALAAWPPPFAPRRLSARDVRESPAYTPARRDAFGAQDLVVLGDRAVMVQEHREGSFTEGPRDRCAVELVSVPVSPFHIEQPRTLRLSAEASGRNPRVAAMDPSAPSRGAFVAYTTGSDMHLLRVVADASPVGWRVTHRRRLADSVPADTLSADIGSLVGGCDVLAAWRTPDSLVVSAVDSSTGRAGQRTVLREGSDVHPPGSRAPGLYIERLGALTVLATEGLRGVLLYQVEQSADCRLTLRPMGLPRTQPFGPGARIAGFAADATRAVLAVTHDPIDAAQTRITFVTLSPESGAITLAPAPETVASSVTQLGLLAPPVSVVAGRGPRGIRLQRVGDAADDGEAGEDLLLRGSRGAEFTLVSSGSLHRVWVADTSGPEPSDFGPAGSVVLFSAIDTLEDGPRTEIRMGSVPHAAFARMTLDPITLDSRPGSPSAWASAWSASTGPDCLPGAFMALYQPDDSPLARARPAEGEPFSFVMSLVPTSLAYCGDRVGTVIWSGSRFAASLSGLRVPSSLVFGDIDSGSARVVPLPGYRGSELHAAALSRLGRGALALWLSGEGRLRYQLYDLNGHALTSPETLTRRSGSDRGTLALSVEGEELAVALPGARGPSLVRGTCRLP